MSEKYLFQWFGLKGEGLITVLFGMGVALYFLKIFNPAGGIIMIVAAILLIIDIAIIINDKAIRSKRGW